MLAKRCVETKNKCLLFVDYCKLEVEGNDFVGDATKCFKGCLSKEENLKLAEAYWEREADADNQQAVCEMLVDGQITVVEIVKEINANIE